MKMMTPSELAEKNSLEQSAYEWIKVPNPPAKRSEKQKSIQQFKSFIPKMKSLLTQFRESYSLPIPGLPELDFLLINYTVKIQNPENKDIEIKSFKNMINLYALQGLLDQISSTEIKQEHVDQFVSNALGVFITLLKEQNLETVTKAYTININFLNALQNVLNIFKNVWSFPRQQMQINYNFIYLAIKVKKTEDEKLIPIMDQTLKIDLEELSFIDMELQFAQNTVCFFIESYNSKSKAKTLINYIYQFASKSVDLFKKLIPSFLPHNETYNQWLIQILQTTHFFINARCLLHAENLVKQVRPIVDEAKKLKLPVHQQYTDSILTKINGIEKLLLDYKQYLGDRPKIVDFLKKLRKDWTPVPVKVKDSTPQTATATQTTTTQSLKNSKKKQKKKQKALQAKAELLPPEAAADPSKALKRNLKKTKKSLTKASSCTRGLQSTLEVSRDELKKSQTQLESTEKKHAQVQQELAETQLTVSYQQQKLKSETSEVRELLTTKKKLSKRLRFLYSHTHSQEDKIQELKKEKTKLLEEKSQQQQQLAESSREIQKLSTENTELNAELIDELEEVDVRTYQTIEQELEIERLSLATDQLVAEKAQESGALRTQLAEQIYVSSIQTIQTTGLLQSFHAVCGLNQQLHSTLQEKDLDLTASHKATESCQSEISRLSKNGQRFGYAGGTDSSMQSTMLGKLTPMSPK